MKVLIIVVTYNAMHWIDKCLTSLRESYISLDVIVIDNLSSDDTVNTIKERYPEVKLIISEKNIGFGRGNNIGLQYGLDHDYDYVYLLNQDAWIFPNTIQEMIKIQKANSEFGILSPMQLQANGEIFDANFGSVTCGYASNNRIISDFFFNKPQKVYEVSSVMAAHWLISRECLLKVGGFSPSFPQYGEDDNYQDRAKYYGFKIGIVTNASAIHDRGDRPYSREKEIKRLYVSNVLALSRISKPYSHPLLYILLNCIRNCFKYKTIKPIGQYASIIKNYKEIHQNTLASMKDCAFLKLKN